MRLICHDCGNEIPDGMDFCPKCGCMAEKATAVDESGIPTRICPKCGTAASLDDRFCKSCGAALGGAAQPFAFVKPKMRRYGALAFMLAVIPGFFNIFGLGHFVLKQWSKGVMFLAISVVVWYVNGWSMFSSSLMMSLISIFIFIYQLNDVSRAMFAPED